MRNILAIAVLTAFSAAAQGQGPAAGGDVVLSTSAGITAGQLYRKEVQRDPFVPVPIAVPGDAQSARLSGLSDKASAVFVPQNLIICGIMTTVDGRQAILYDKATKSPYYLLKGKLYDEKNKPVKGISGVINGRQIALMLENGEIVKTSLPNESVYSTSARDAKKASKGAIK